MADMKLFAFLVVLSCGLSICHASLGDILSKHHGLQSNPNVLCIMEHCGTQFSTCMEDIDCRDNMVCVLKCGPANNTCLYECINTYDDAVYDDLVRCMVSEHHCMELQSPDPTFRCSKPKQFLTNFNISQFNGSWYISVGLNKLYDCFDCQLVIYSPTPKSKNYTLTGYYDVTTLNGSVRHRVNVHQQLEQKDAQFGGLIDFTNNVMGLTMSEKWQVIDYSPDGQYLIVYYCGNMTPDWWYEGVLVFSRQPQVTPKYLPNVTRTLEFLGHKIDEFCTVNNSVGCKFNPPQV